MFILLLCTFVSAAKWDNTQLKWFQCDMSTTQNSIQIIGWSMIVLFVCFLAYKSKIALFELLIGLVTLFFSMNVGACYWLAHVPFILIGIYLIWKGYQDSYKT